MVKRLLIKVIVKPVWVEVDDDDNATELVSEPRAVAPKQLHEYADQLLAFAEKAKRGEIESQPQQAQP
jgi:hypothetical protein